MVEKTSIGTAKLVRFTLLLILFIVAGQTWAQTKDLNKSFSTVVMIEGKQQGSTSFGAGIVIGSRAGRIYIATANHVVRSGRTPATDIKVQFRFLPGEKYPAKLLDTKNRDLDLAVLSVTAPAGEIPVSEFKFKVLGDSSQLKRGSDVHPLGNPQAQAWGVALSPEKVDSIKVSKIVFQSSYIQKGHSGGALLDSCGDIAGLIVTDSPPTANAIRIESVLQELQRWNYPVNMIKTGGCAPVTKPTPSVDEKPVKPVEKVYLDTGTSKNFEISQSGSLAYFMYTPESSRVHTITVVSEPASHDLGWAIYKDQGLTQMVVDCDNDYPSRGRESCVANLQAGQQYSLVVSNLRGDEPGESGGPVKFTITIYPNPADPAATEYAQGSINIRYTGDAGNCNVNIAIDLTNNNRTITPTGNIFRVDNLALGNDYYQIYGIIECSLWGSACTATGEGDIVLQNGYIYDIVWEPASFGACNIGLYNLLE